MLWCQSGKAVTEAADFRELFQNCFGDFVFKESPYPGRDSGGFNQT